MIKKKEQILEKEIPKANHNIISKNNLKVSSWNNFRLKDYLIKPFISGLIGFSLFMIVVVGTEYLSFILKDHDIFKIDESEFILSSIGFICFFLITALKNYSKSSN